MVRIALAAVAITAAGPAAVAEEWVNWTLVADDRGASLVYGGSEGSDDVRVSLSCDSGSRRLSVAFPIDRRVAVRLGDDGEWIDANGRRAPWPAEVGIEAGAAGQAFEASLRDYELNEGSWAEAEAPTADVRELLTSAGAAREALSFYVASQAWAEPLYEKVTPPPVPGADLDALLAVCG